MIHNEPETNNETRHIPTLHDVWLRQSDVKHGLVSDYTVAPLEHEETTRYAAINVALSPAKPTMPSRVTSAFGLVSRYKALEQQCDVDTSQSARTPMSTMRRCVTSGTLFLVATAFVIAAWVGQGNEVISVVRVVMHVLGVR